MVMRAPASLWVVDPDDPRAPPDDIWDQMTDAERRRVIDSLPSEIEASEALPPEGDLHFNTKVSVKDTLGGYFSRVGRRVYIAAELPVYYPGEKMFAPDIFAVLDVELKERMGWVVRAEGKGLDFALEVIVSGERRKDLQRNVERYARLGIAEYFVFDRARLQLRGHRLPSTGARVYKPILAQGGTYSSHVLGLDLRIEGTRLRFYHANAPIPDSMELIARLESLADDMEQRLAAAMEQAAEEARLRAEEAERRAEEAKLRAEEAKLRAEAEEKLAAALARIAELEAAERNEQR